MFNTVRKLFKRASITQGNALADTRKELVAVMTAVLDQKLQDALYSATIALDDYCQGGLTWEELMATLHAFEFNGADDFDDDQLQTFAACLDYLQHRDEPLTAALFDEAARIIDGGNYHHYAKAYDEDTLGDEVVADRIGWRNLPEWILNYIDLEQLGSDTLETENGYFGKYGYFGEGSDR